jgi:gluconolactonase
MRRLTRLSLVYLLFFLPALGLATSPAEEPGQCIPGLGPVAGLHRIAAGFVFTEGPAVDRHGNLYFTDQLDGPGKIWRLDTQGKLELFQEDAHRANGLKINAQGEIVACEMASGCVVAYSPDGKRRRILASEFQGQRFIAPNDLAIDRHGGIYFTDPIFRNPDPLHRPQPHTAVYYIAPTGEVIQLITNLWNPNGIVLSPDQSTLYVIPTCQRKIMAYPVLAPGCLGPGQVVTRPTVSLCLLYPGGDGAAVDVLGNLYVTRNRGVEVYSPAGQYLGLLRVPERPANVTFGGPDGRTLYVTARTSIYAGRMLVPGLP